MKNPLVSVIVLCYNQEKTVGAAIESVMRQQSSAKYEIVIGDDDSSDSTPEICRSYAERYPETVRLLPSAGKNLGLVANYFRCLRECRGEYISDCAGDDCWTGSSKLEAAAAILRDRPGVYAVVSDYVERDCASGREYRAESLLAPLADRDGTVSGREILRRTFCRTGALPYMLSTAVYRKSVITDAMAANPSMIENDDFGCEDMPVIAALAAAGDAVLLPSATLIYTVGGDSVSHTSDRLKSARFYLRTLRATRVLGTFYGIPERDMAPSFIAKSRYVASAAFRLGDTDLARALEKETDSWRLPLPSATRLYLGVMKWRVLYKTALTLLNTLRLSTRK